MIINTFFDKIYVINLKESIDRKNHIIKEFNKNKIINYEFFEATHFNEPSVSELLHSNKVVSFPPCFRCLKNRCNCENNFLTKYQIANWLSYINLFEKILKSEHNLVLICEDDIVFSDNSQFILNSLLNESTFKKHKINFDLPLLIKMGAAYSPLTHNLFQQPQYIKNYSLSNPCFAVNKHMIKLFLYNLKIIDYHSDVYFHQKIPKYFKNLQVLVMNPFPVYELSFVDNVKKFNSLVRPKNEIRRKEYKEFLFVTIHKLLEFIPVDYCKKLKINVSNSGIGYNGTINNFYLLDTNNQSKYYFKNKIFIYDNFEEDIKIIQSDINFKKKSYMLEIIYLVIDKYELEICQERKDILKNIKIIYPFILKYFEDNEFLMININESNIFEKYDFINKYIDLKNSIYNYNVLIKD